MDAATQFEQIVPFREHILSAFVHFIHSSKDFKTPTQERIFRKI